MFFKKWRLKTVRKRNRLAPIESHFSYLCLCDKDQRLWSGLGENADFGERELDSNIFSTAYMGI